MNWTKTPPTKPGAYWWRKSVKDFVPRLLEVWSSGQVFGDTPGRTYDINNPSKPEYVKEISGEWCGPLVPVEEVAKAWIEGNATLCHSGNAGNYYLNSRACRVVEGEEQV